MNNKDTQWTKGYKAGQRKMARKILEMPTGMMGDLEFLLHRLCVIARSKDMDKNFF